MREYKYEKELREKWNNPDIQKYWYICKERANDPNTYATIDNLEYTFKRILTPATLQAYLKYYTITLEDGLKQVVFPKAVYGASPLAMPCAEATEESRGLYFIAMTGFNPVTDEKYYLCKVGAAYDSIKKRVNQYRGMNPMIYHNNICLPVPYRENRMWALEEMETNCHKYLAARAKNVADGTKEWFYFSENEYMRLCNIFASRRLFNDIANGCVK